VQVSFAISQKHKAQQVTFAHIGIRGIELAKGTHRFLLIIKTRSRRPPTMSTHTQPELLHDALGSTHTGTFEWISGQPNLSAWISPRVSDSKTKNRLALFGLPDHGKASTTAFLAEHLTKRGSIVCSHLCGQASASPNDPSFKTREENELAKLSKSILSQLQVSRSDLAPMMRASMNAWSRKPRVTPTFAAKAPLLHWLPELIAESQQ
jgi:hypothetical protein